MKTDAESKRDRPLRSISNKNIEPQIKIACSYKKKGVFWVIFDHFSPVSGFWLIVSDHVPGFTPDNFKSVLRQILRRPIYNMSILNDAPWRNKRTNRP